jgi:recombinational DNA repair protein (RecF pathway)
MQEYVSNAVILRKEPMGDIDARYVLFTERFGKVIAKAKSSRKVTSKLAPHLEPGTLSKVRFIETHGTQLIDALKNDRTTVSLQNLHLLSRLLPDAQPEPELWQALLGEQFSWPMVLSILGWDPAEAECSSCAALQPNYFYVPRQEFFCNRCVLKIPLKIRRDAVLSLDGEVQS